MLIATLILLTLTGAAIFAAPLRCKAWVALAFVVLFALGGTAVGTGLNAPAGFAEEVAAEISRLTGKDFRSAPNKFHALTSRDELVFAHGALQALAEQYGVQAALIEQK